MNIINLTPHAINVVKDDGTIIASFPPSGAVARVDTITDDLGPLNVHPDIPVVVQSFGAVKGLPDPQPDTIYLVSMVVGQAAGQDRDDLLGPDTSPAGAVRDADGRIIGTRRLVYYGRVNPRP